MVKVSHAGWKYEFAEDNLESRWSWRSQVAFSGTGTVRVIFGWKDAKNFSLVEFGSAESKTQSRPIFYQVKNGDTNGFSATGPLFNNARGELALQKQGNRVRALWNGEIVGGTWLSDENAVAGTQFGVATQGAVKIEDNAPQPTESVPFSDDFMRAEGPDAEEIPSQWATVGSWKTSGNLGPKSDAALNPNPFVFRAQGQNENVARAGKWWWSDYSVSASVRAAQTDEKSPLRAGIEAFSGTNGAGIRGEIDFKRGVAVLKDGAKILAQSARFDAEPNQWHRLRLQPGPGTAQLFVDGILRVSAPSQRAQGAVALRAVAGKENHVDFDDVRVGTLATGQQWGEGALPDRFQKDRLMRNWASDASAWKRDASGTWWHTGDFFGDMKLEMLLPQLEVGDGFEILLAADAKNPKAGLRYEISRPDSKPETAMSFVLRHSQGVAGAKIMRRFPQANGETRLRFDLKRTKTGFLRVESRLGLNQLTEKGQPPSSAFGTQVGIRPLKNGAPLPPSQLQKVSLASKTFERGGRTVVGVNLTPISPEIARTLGLPDASGAVVDIVEAGSPALEAGLREGDVIRGIDGARVTDVDSMRAAVGAVKPGTPVRLDILRPHDNSGLDWSKCAVSTPNVLDYSFTAAPVDWRAASGTWDVAERWTCSPQWSFFAGQGDISPLLTSRFATRGDWTLEAYLATPMDPTRSERSPADLNISVGGDGIDLASGYSFIFAGKNRSVNQIRRGDGVAWEKAFEMPPGAGDTHQDWFYVRLERRQTAQGVRFRYSVNGRELVNYLDPKPLADGGHLSFWTQNGALSVARVRLWHAGTRTPQAAPHFPVVPVIAPDLENGLGVWSVRGEGPTASAQLVLASQTSNPVSSRPSPTLQIINPRSGGDWTTFVTRKPFKPTLAPTLEWDYRVSSDVKLNLYALVDGVWREIVFTGGTFADANDSTSLGVITGVVADGKWHHARFDLLSALRSKGIAADTVEALAFAAPARDYLRSGLGGNHRGATYWLRDFKASQPTN